MSDHRILDADATAIGELYRKARTSMVDSIRCLAEAGRKLSSKKASLGHGKWVPWLEANAETLGFETPRTAQRLLLIGRKYDVNVAFDEGEALRLNRIAWGNDDRQPREKVAKAREVAEKPEPTERRVTSVSKPTSANSKSPEVAETALTVVNPSNDADEKVENPADRDSVLDSMLESMATFVDNDPSELMLCAYCLLGRVQWGAEVSEETFRSLIRNVEMLENRIKAFRGEVEPARDEHVDQPNAREATYAPSYMSDEEKAKILARFENADKPAKPARKKKAKV